MTRARHPAPKLLLFTLLTMALALAACGPRTADAPEAGKAAEATPAASGGGRLPLPSLSYPCNPDTHPQLPAKWEAVALMQDFFHDTFWVGKFIYDESAQAFRFSLADQYGIEADLLVTLDRKLYWLEGGDEPTSCVYLTASSPFTVPPRDWLAADAKCVGQAPILTRDQQWWKSKSDVGANWYWFDSKSRLPFRSMYYTDAKPTTPVPIYEHFTFNYFPTFQEVPATGLGKILAMCQSKKSAPAATAEWSRPSIEPLMKKSTYPQTNAAKIAQIEKWIPGLTSCSSLDSLPPPWPEQTQLTAFMTAVNFDYNPFPTRVFYDWKKQAQNSLLNYYYLPGETKTYASQLALLLNNSGYIAMVNQDGSIASCSQALPGPQVRNWKQVDGCECRAQIAPKTVLNPSDVPTKILWCPTDLTAKQVFWTWYSDTGTPIVFMQTNSSPTAGTGLNLADYHGWAPGSIAPPGIFDLPQACQGATVPPDAFPQACHNCHLPLNTKKAS